MRYANLEHSEGLRDNGILKRTTAQKGDQIHRESLQYTSSIFSLTSNLTSSIMVNPLLLLPLLNASSLTATTNGCYEQKPRGQPQLVPTTFTVCSQAINNMAYGRALDTPLAFGRSVKVGHKLPDQFTHRGFYATCVIQLSMRDGVQDSLTWRDIIVSASELRDWCVALSPHLGGERKVGSRQLLNVEVFAIDNEAEMISPGDSSGLVQGRPSEA